MRVVCCAWFAGANSYRLVLFTCFLPHNMCELEVTNCYAVSLGVQLYLVHVFNVFVSPENVVRGCCSSCVVCGHAQPDQPEAAWLLAPAC